MKIRIFTLISALAIGVVTSMAQLSWVYDNQTLADGETITVNDEAGSLIVGFYVGIQNNGGNDVSATISRSINTNNGFSLTMCVGTNCLPPDTETTPSFGIQAGSVYEDFHVQAIPLGTEGIANATFTVSDGVNSAKINIEFVLDGNPDNNGVTIGTTGVADVTGAEEYGIVMKGNELCVTGTREGQQVRVIDLTGRVAASFVVAGDSTQRYDLNLGRGIYLVALQDGGRTVYTQKVISR